MPTVADIMDSNVVTVRPEDDIRAAIDTLRDHDLPGVPVVDDDERCVGIVTESDLILRDEEADIHLPHHIDIMGGIIWLESTKHFEARVKKALASNVGQMMTADPVTVSPSAPVEEAARLIAERKHNRLPVVGEDGRVVGVVTRVDVLDALTS